MCHRGLEVADRLSQHWLVSFLCLFLCCPTYIILSSWYCVVWYKFLCFFCFRLHLLSKNSKCITNRELMWYLVLKQVMVCPVTSSTHFYCIRKKLSNPARQNASDWSDLAQKNDDVAQNSFVEKLFQVDWYPGGVKLAFFSGKDF